MTTSSRPEPLADAALDVAKAYGPVMGLITALVSAGVLSLSTGHLLTAIYGVIPGVLAFVATVIGAKALVVAARPAVTPLSDPRNNLGQRLVPEPPPPPPPLEPPPLEPGVPTPPGSVTVPVADRPDPARFGPS